MFGIDSMHQQVIDKSPLCVEQPGVLGLAIVETGCSVAAQGVDQIDCLGTADFDFSHVADIEYADTSPYGLMLGDNARVFDRHFPAAEIDHASSGRSMNSIQRRLPRADMVGRVSLVHESTPVQAATGPSGYLRGQCSAQLASRCSTRRDKASNRPETRECCS